MAKKTTAKAKKKTTKAAKPPILLPAVAENNPSPRYSVFKHGVSLGLKSFLVLTILSLLSLSVLASQRPLSQVRFAGQAISPTITSSELEQLIKERAGDYELKIAYTDGSQKSFKLSEAGLEIRVQSSATKILQTLADLSYAERLQWWRTHDVELLLSTDAPKFQTFIRDHAIKPTVAPQNAQLKIESGKAIIIPEARGEGSSINEPETAITKAAANLDPKPLVMSSRELAPAITTSSLTAKKRLLDSALGQTVSFNIEGDTIKPSATDIAGWIELTPVESEKTIDVTVNSGKVLEYLDQISKPYVQPPRSQVIMKSGSGQEVVLAYGHNGTDVVNKEAIASDVAERLLDAKGIDVDLPVKYAPFKTISAQAYDKWIVVDTTNKRMYAYEGNKLVRTFLVSAGAPGTPTVTGQYSIYSKVRIQDMRGLNTDGSRYFQPNVEWVNYFYADYAIHGNYWRPLDYFGNVNSSHGCVGVVNADGEWIYNWAPVGTPVIVHT